MDLVTFSSTYNRLFETTQLKMVIKSLFCQYWRRHSS